MNLGSAAATLLKTNWLTNWRMSADWCGRYWPLGLVLFGSSLALASLTQIVIHASTFSHDQRFLDLLKHLSGQTWGLAAIWLIALGWRIHHTPETCRLWFSDRIRLGIFTFIIATALTAPFLTTAFTHFTHPVLAMAIAWTIWPFLVGLQRRLSLFIKWPDNRFYIHLTPWIIFGSLFTLFFVQSYRRHLWFGSGGKDLGLFHQSVWLLSRFELPHNTILGMHTFADHLEFIDILAAPLQWIWPEAGALLLFQSLVVALGAVPVFKLAHYKLGSIWAGTAMALAYGLGMDIQNAIMFDFNPTTCGAGIIPWVVWYFDRQRPVAFVIALALLAACKENLVIYGFGLCLALAQKPKRRLALACAAALAVFFIIEMQIIFPIFRPEGFRHLRFNNLGTSAFEIAKTILAAPAYAFGLLFTPSSKLDGLLLPLSSVAFAIFLAPRYFLALAPIIFERFWSDHASRWWGHHYGAGAGVIAVIAAIEGLAYLRNHSPKSQRFFGLGMAVLGVFLSCVLVSSLGRFGTGALWLKRDHYYTSAADRENALKMLEAIPKEASVAAQNHLIPYLSARREIYELHRPIRAEYVALDLVQSAWPWEPKYARELGLEILQQGFGVVACEGAAIAFRRGAPQAVCPSLGR